MFDFVSQPFNKYNYSTKTCDGGPDNCRSYLALVWANTSAAGCAAYICPDIEFAPGDVSDVQISYCMLAGGPDPITDMYVRNPYTLRGINPAGCTKCPSATPAFSCNKDKLCSEARTCSDSQNDRDQYPDCVRWAAAGLCSIIPGAVERLCPASCNNCWPRVCRNSAILYREEDCWRYPCSS